MTIDRTSVETGSPPLSAMLSQAVIAFTIELDNEFEHRMQHRTALTKYTAPTHSPWLASYVVWSNFLRYVPEEGISIRDVRLRARTEHLPLAGMERWGYITIERDSPESRTKPPKPHWILRPTPNARKAQAAWTLLPGEIEARWATRFGADKIDKLRESLLAVVNELGFELPDFLPILRYGMFVEVPDPTFPPAENPDTHLVTLLSKVLHAFTIEFEREPTVSLAMCADVLRLLGDEGVRVGELPRRACVSKEAISMAMTVLSGRGYAVVEPDPAAVRGKVVRLTPKGRTAQMAHPRRLVEIESDWRNRFGADRLDNMHAALAAVVGTADDASSPLFLGLEPYPDGWRASVRKPDGLAHFPMVLHRGGYPDGS